MIRQKTQFLHTAKTSCQATQQRVLQLLLTLNSGSRFSQDMGLKPGLSVSEFRERMPVVDYEFFRPYVDRMQTGEHNALLGQHNKLLMYALTSGTTSQPKLIPITQQFVKDYRRGWQHWGIDVHQNHQKLQYQRIVQISSSHNKWLAPDGIPCGNISGLVTSMQKAIVRKLYVIPAAVTMIDDPVAKQYTVLRFALAEPQVGMFVTANPSTLLHFCKDADANGEQLIRDVHNGTLTIGGISDNTSRKLSRYLTPRHARARQLEAAISRSGRLLASDCWPDLQCLGVWSGGSAGAYIPQLLREFGQVSVRDHGLHASEGRMTIPFESGTSAGVLDIESHFFEFIPAEEIESTSPTTLETHELQINKDYYILLTTSSGLYRYNIRDVVRCVGYFGATPMLEFRHKGSHISSITGEKITESQVVDAVGMCCKELRIMLSQFTLTPAWADPPGYILYIGLDDQLQNTERQLFNLAVSVDRCLAELNCEYAEKRATGRLSPISCQPISDSAWKSLKNYRLTTSGGSVEQYKHPCLMPDPNFEQMFCVAAGIQR